MATVSKDIADNVISNDGYYNGDRSPMGDPRVIRVVRYNNMFDGGEAYGLIYEGEDLDRYHASGACHNTATIWDANPNAMGDAPQDAAPNEAPDEAPDEGFPGW